MDKSVRKIKNRLLRYQDYFNNSQSLISDLIDLLDENDIDYDIKEDNYTSSPYMQYVSLKELAEDIYKSEAAIHIGGIK